MKIGELRDKILIQKRHEVIDDLTGMPIFTYEDLFTLRAKKKTVSTKDYISSDKIIKSIILKFVCRKSEVNTDLFVMYKFDRYEIKHIHEFEDNMYIELTCEVVT